MLMPGSSHGIRYPGPGSGSTRPQQWLLTFRRGCWLRGLRPHGHGTGLLLPSPRRWLPALREQPRQPQKLRVRGYWGRFSWVGLFVPGYERGGRSQPGRRLLPPSGRPGATASHEKPEKPLWHGWPVWQIPAIASPGQSAGWLNFTRAKFMRWQARITGESSPVGAPGSGGGATETELRNQAARQGAVRSFSPK